ncbi:trypsin-7-like [Schistocerca gregaria]|uniref:trypsin-7-like n=1 Tax=Schistocerca gregaria TaxID=7010 RepID=UPI00211E7EAA|nr:trypsin-7-like [Schistocerca gregaria]
MFRLAVLLVCLLSPGLASPTRGRLWRTGQARIIGGTEANISNFPWQVSVEAAGDHTCGGSLISPDWVLTSSLCLDGFSGVFEHLLQFVSLRAGTSTKGSGGVVLLAAEMYEHPLYIPLTVDYDVALIKVNGSFALGPNVQAVSLPEQGYDPPVGLPVTITGWGYNVTDGSLSSVLQKVDVNIVDRAVCQATYVIRNVTARMVCAGELLRGSCDGDFGGPLVSGSTQVGVLSWTLFPCELGLDVYANVGSVRSWISEVSGV